MASGGWCTIESDPGVFTELISQIGVKGVQVEELYDLEQSSLEQVKPVYGLIFLFKWQQEEDNRPIAYDAPGVFFANQVINNACATQAIISVLLNRTNEIDIGTELSQFREFTLELPSDMRGLAISNSDSIREAHNSFGRPEPFHFTEEKDKDGEAEDAFHFIGYVPVQGQLYELDGLKQGPIALGACTNDTWLEVARNAINQRIQRYAAKEIRFNLLALVQNRREVYTAQLSKLESRRTQIESKIAGQDVGMDIDGEELPSDINELQTRLHIIQDEIRHLQSQIDDEKHKYEKWKTENIRRKHNYVPFIFNLLKTLAAKGQLTGLVESASKATAERQARKNAEKEKIKKESTISSSSTSSSTTATKK